MSSIGLAWWSGNGLLPFLALFVVPIAAGLQFVITWFKRSRPQAMWIGSIALWLVPCLYIGWWSYQWQKPENIFTRITSLPVPDGVTNLRARMVMGLEGTGWIHFEATEMAKQDLISQAGLIRDMQLNTKGTAYLVDYGGHAAMRHGIAPIALKNPVAFRTKRSTIPQPMWVTHALWVMDEEGTGVWIAF